MRRASGAVILGCWLVWTLLAPLSSLALAHTTLVSSSPAEGARLDAPPTAIELVFSEPVDARLVTVVVSSIDGRHWEDGVPVVSDAIVSQPVRPLVDAGDYSVAYRVVSTDGHPVTGLVRFTLTGSAPMTTPGLTAAASSRAEAPPGSTGDDASGTAAWTYAAIGIPVAALLFAGGVAIARARSRGGMAADGR